MAVKKILVSGVTDDPIRSLIENFNDLLAKLDLDATVTDTDYASTLKVQDVNGRDI